MSDNKLAISQTIHIIKKNTYECTIENNSGSTPRGTDPAIGEIHDDHDEKESLLNKDVIRVNSVRKRQQWRSTSKTQAILCCIACVLVSGMALSSLLISTELLREALTTTTAGSTTSSQSHNGK